MTGGNPAKKGMRIMTQNVAAQKRTVATSAMKEGLSVQASYPGGRAHRSRRRS